MENLKKTEENNYVDYFTKEEKDPKINFIKDATPRKQQNPEKIISDPKRELRLKTRNFGVRMYISRDSDHFYDALEIIFCQNFYEVNYYNESKIFFNMEDLTFDEAQLFEKFLRTPTYKNEIEFLKWFGFSDDWYLSTPKHLWVISDEINEEIKEQEQEQEQPENEIDEIDEDIINDVILDYETCLGEYNLYGENKQEKENSQIYRLPYRNFSSGYKMDCVYSYVSERWDYSKRMIRKFFNFDEKITQKNIVAFTKKYKLECKIYDIFGDILYRNEYKFTRKQPKRKRFICIIFANHLYPFRENFRNTVPDFAEKESELDQESAEFIPLSIEKNNKIYMNGQVKTNNETIINRAFFKGLPSNFNYECEKNFKMRAMAYNNTNEKERKCKQLIDMKKAYYGVITRYKGLLPCFNCMDLWNNFDKNKSIRPNSYYLLDIVPKYFRNNFMHGFIAKKLIKIGLIKKENILFEKIPFYTISAEDINKRIQKTYKEIQKQDEIDEKEKKPKKEFKANFSHLYNGILGRNFSKNQRIIRNISKNDAKLLKKYYKFRNEAGHEKNNNVGLNLKILTKKKLMQNDHDFILTSKTHYKKLNTVNIYNFIVDLCNLSMLNMIEKHGMRNIVYLKTDSVGFNKEIYKTAPLYWRIETGIENKDFSGKIGKSIDIIGKNILSEIRNEINPNNTILITGRPGSGKTYSEKKQKKYHIATTISNLCCLNLSMDSDIKAQTFYSLLNLYTREKVEYEILRLGRQNKTILIDEFSMFSGQYWNYIYLLAQSGAQLRVIGDPNQISPIGPKDSGNEEIDINNEFFNLFILPENRTHLTTNFRNDKIIYKLSEESLNLDHTNTLEYIRNLQKYNNENDTFEKLIKQPDTIFTCYFKSVRAKINLMCIKERKLNYCTYVDVINKKSNKKTSFKLKNLPRENIKINTYKYTFEISKGMRLYNCRNVKAMSLFKGDLYEVLDDVNKYSKNVQLISIHSKKIFNINISYLLYMRPGFAINVHLLQGLTVKKSQKYIICQCSEMLRRDYKLFYTALTRAISIEQIYFTNKKTDNDIKKQILTSFDEMHLVENEANQTFVNEISAKFNKRMY